MAMNEVNPLSFIRRVIPDTAAKTNADTFKQQATLGLQNNKQAAAMAKALQEIAGREKVSRLNNNISLSASGTGLDNILNTARDADLFKTRASGAASLREGNLQSQAPSGSTLAQITDPSGKVNHILDKGVLQGIQLGKNQSEQTDSEEQTVEYTDFNPTTNRYEKRRGTNKSGTKEIQKRPVKSTSPPSPEPANVQAQQQQPAAPTGVVMPAQTFDEQLENGTIQLDPNGSGRHFVDNGDGNATIVVRGQ